MLDGESNYYHKNGNLKVINYNWKKWTLYSKYYNIHGQIESEGGFKDIYKDGSWKYYYKDGQIKKEIVWTGMSKSNIISKKCWNENGNKIECEE
jgi:antitoxin component YwqK of YwqJK toxin-antitoxin module